MAAGTPGSASTLNRGSASGFLCFLTYPSPLESAKVDGIIHDPQYVGEEAASVQYEGMIYPIQEWRPPNWPPHFPPLRIIRYKGIQRLVIVPTDPLCLGAFYMLQQTQEGLKQLDAAAAAVAGPPAAGTGTF